MPTAPLHSSTTHHVVGGEWEEDEDLLQLHLEEQKLTLSPTAPKRTDMSPS